MRFPDFLLIGAAKSGTTALFYYLGQHPDLFACPVREPNFFALENHKLEFPGPGDEETVGKHSVTNLEGYRRLFDGSDAEQKAGEVSPLYLYAREAPARIKRYIPDVRLIVVLRHPVDRAYASYLHLRRDGREVFESFEEALSSERERIVCGWEHLWHYVEMGRYATQIQRYLDCFNAAQIKVILYEDFQAHPVEVVQQCFEFLNVDTHFIPDFSRRPNQSGIPRSRFTQQVLSGDGYVKRLMAKYLPEKIKGRILTQVQRMNLHRPLMDEELRRELNDLFKEEIILLQDLIDRDLSHWLND